MNSILKKLLKNVGFDFLFGLLLDEVLKMGEGELARSLSKRMTATRRVEVAGRLRKVAENLDHSNYTAAAKEIIAVLKDIKL